MHAPLMHAVPEKITDRLAHGRTCLLVSCSTNVRLVAPLHRSLHGRGTIGEVEATFANEPRSPPLRWEDERENGARQNGKGRRYHRIECWGGPRDGARICQTRLQRRPDRPRPAKAGGSGGGDAWLRR